MNSDHNQVQLVYSNPIGNLVTSSMTLAKKFNKEHKAVLRLIRKVIKEHGQEVGVFFAPTYTIDEQNRKQSAYELSEEGFALVAFRFTGLDARKWQTNYVLAFSKMKSVLPSNFSKDVFELNTKLKSVEKERDDLAKYKPTQVRNDNKVGLSLLLGVNSRAATKFLDLFTERKDHEVIQYDRFKRFPLDKYKHFVTVKDKVGRDQVLFDPEFKDVIQGICQEFIDKKYG
jgi:Rha family phage regulatory protein